MWLRRLVLTRVRWELGTTSEQRLALGISRLLLAVQRCARIQLSSGTLWPGSISPCAVPRVPYTGGRPKARLEEALPALLPTPSPCCFHPSPALRSSDRTLGRVGRWNSILLGWLDP